MSTRHSIIRGTNVSAGSTSGFQTAISSSTRLRISRPIENEPSGLSRTSWVEPRQLPPQQRVRLRQSARLRGKEPEIIVHNQLHVMFAGHPVRLISWNRMLSGLSTIPPPLVLCTL